jgi:hypothetical protein
VALVGFFLHSPQKVVILGHPLLSLCCRKACKFTHIKKYSRRVLQELDSSDDEAGLPRFEKVHGNYNMMEEGTQVGFERRPPPPPSPLPLPTHYILEQVASAAQQTGSPGALVRAGRLGGNRDDMQSAMKTRPRRMLASDECQEGVGGQAKTASECAGAGKDGSSADRGVSVGCTDSGEQNGCQLLEQREQTQLEVDTEEAARNKTVFTLEQDRLIFQAGREAADVPSPHAYENTWKQLRSENREGLGSRTENEMADRYDFLVAQAIVAQTNDRNAK